jgi:hypothetical protein
MIRCLLLWRDVLMPIAAHNIDSNLSLCVDRDALNQPTIDFRHENNGALG